MRNANAFHLSPGGYLTVKATSDTVAQWARRWPCYGPARALVATFDPRGDLVELAGDLASNDERGIAAIVQDLQLWAILQINHFES